jgi:hypothetical protein
MAKYVVLIPADEAAWESTPQEERERVYQAHADFAALLAQRGHRFVEGAELAPAAQAKVVSGSLDQVSVTDGPYAEAAEQLSGFYVIDTDDLDDLLRCVGRICSAEGRLEVRPYRGDGM